jgi:hypothetical protein
VDECFRKKEISSCPLNPKKEETIENPILEVARCDFKLCPLLKKELRGYRHENME